MKIFVQGAWVDTTAHVFVDGAWKLAFVWLFINGAWQKVSKDSSLPLVDISEYTIDGEQADFNFVRDIGGRPRSGAITINIKPSGKVKPTDATVPAFSFGAPLKGVTITINNEGGIYGKGGKGGQGGPSLEDLQAEDGQRGGDAFLIDTDATVIINNSGTIGAGGGGAGGGGSIAYKTTRLIKGGKGGDGADGDQTEGQGGPNGAIYGSGSKGRAVGGKGGNGGAPSKPGADGHAATYGKYHYHPGGAVGGTNSGAGNIGGYVINGINKVTFNDTGTLHGVSRDLPTDGVEFLITGKNYNINILEYIKEIPEADKIYITVLGGTSKVLSKDPKVPAMVLGNTFRGKTIVLQNEGTIVGKGGKGGSRGGYVDKVGGNGQKGGDGGTAIQGTPDNPVIIINKGIIGGGGGGGGGTAGVYMEATRSGRTTAYPTPGVDGPDGRDGDNPVPVNANVDPFSATKISDGASGGSSGKGGGAGQDGTSASAKGRTGAILSRGPRVSFVSSGYGGPGGYAGLAFDLPIVYQEKGTVYGKAIADATTRIVDIPDTRYAFNLHDYVGDTTLDDIVINIADGAKVYSPDPTKPAFTIGAEYVGKTITINNLGTIAGKGGKGGAGSGGHELQEDANGKPGEDGGLAVELDTKATVIINNKPSGIIAGGAGGGGGAGGTRVTFQGSVKTGTGSSGSTTNYGDSGVVVKSSTPGKVYMGRTSKYSKYYLYPATGGSAGPYNSDGQPGGDAKAASNATTVTLGLGGAGGKGSEAIKGTATLNNEGTMYGGITP